MVETAEWVDLGFPRFHDGLYKTSLLQLRPAHLGPLVLPVVHHDSKHKDPGPHPHKADSHLRHQQHWNRLCSHHNQGQEHQHPIQRQYPAPFTFNPNLRSNMQFEAVYYYTKLITLT